MVPLGRCPNYCATKAALHHFCISLRAHLKDTSVRVIEIMPPAVQTELHDEKYQPGEFTSMKAEPTANLLQTSRMARL